MKLLMAGAASLSALVLSGCGMLGENEGPPPESPAASAIETSSMQFGSDNQTGTP